MSAEAILWNLEALAFSWMFKVGVCGQGSPTFVFPLSLDVTEEGVI